METRTTRGTDRYLELVKTFPLRPIRSERDQDEAMAAYKRLLFQDHPLSQDEEDYMEALLMLVQGYEARHKIHLGPKDPVAMVKHLMGERDMNVSDLGRVIGSQPNASLILRRRRQLSKANIYKLAAFFQVDPGVFL